MIIALRSKISVSFKLRHYIEQLSGEWPLDLELLQDQVCWGDHCPWSLAFVICALLLQQRVSVQMSLQLNSPLFSVSTHIYIFIQQMQFTCKNGQGDAKKVTHNPKVQNFSCLFQQIQMDKESLNFSLLL